MTRFRIISFGFKYGEPYPNADLRIDLRRRLANPQSHLPKRAVGTDAVVKQSVLGSDKNRKVFESCFSRAQDLARSVERATIAFGCTSGIHRSVVFAVELAHRLRKAGHEVEVAHLHLKYPAC